jgi:hypothetical protein
VTRGGTIRYAAFSWWAGRLFLQHGGLLLQRTSSAAVGENGGGDLGGCLAASLGLLSIRWRPAARGSRRQSSN